MLLRLKDKISLKDIAIEHFVSIPTVQRIMDHWLQRSICF
ncbi:helix-turn-helix domain-containing protein [Fusobacterium hominis]